MAVTNADFQASGNTPHKSETLKIFVSGNVKALAVVFQKLGGIESGPAPLLASRLDKTANTSASVNALPKSLGLSICCASNSKASSHDKVSNYVTKETPVAFT